MCRSTDWCLFVLAVILLTVFAALAAHGTNTSYAAVIAVGDVRFSNLSLHNVSGHEIDTVEVNQQSVIRVTMHNNDESEWPFVILVEVRDGDGVARYLAWQSGKIGSNENYTMETSWIPSDDGTNYQIRSFAVTEFEHPKILSPAYSVGGITVIESPYYTSPGQLHYDLIINNQTFQIDYYFSNGNGKVARIEADTETKNMVFHLVTPRDSYLSVILPKGLIPFVFVEGMLSEELPIFVDEVPIDVRHQINTSSGSVRFVIPLNQGAEVLEIVGTSII